MNKIRIAVAGAGYIGLAHMAVAQKSPQVRAFRPYRSGPRR